MGIQVKTGDHTVRLRALLGFCVTRLMCLFCCSVVRGEVSAAPLAVCWSHLHMSRGGPVWALGQQHQGAARCNRYDLSSTHADESACDCETFSDAVASFFLFFVFYFPASRPKHLLVYINPYGGKRQGKHIYEQKVAPLFALAGISTDVIGTYHLTHFLLLGFLWQHGNM